MVVVLRPPQRRLSPVGSVKIDWSHPITRGLSLVQLFQDESTGDYPLFIDNGSLGASTTPASIGVAPGGIGITGSATWAHNSNLYSIPTTAGTCISYVTVGWSPTDSNDHQGITANSFWHIRKFADNNWYNGWNFGSDTRVVVAASGTFSAGDTFSAALTWQASGTKFYTKGILRGSNGSTPATVNTSAATYSINSNNFTATAGRDAIYYVIFWSRVLGDDEIALLDADPYCFLIPAEGEMPALEGAAAAVVPPFIPNSNDNFNVRQAAQRAAAALLIATQPFVPFNTTQVAPAVAKGWYNQLSPAPKAAVAIPTLPTQFSAPYQNTIPGIAWHRWQDPINGGVRNAKAWPTQTTQFAVPASVAPPAQTPGQFGWWANLSKPAPVAQAKPGSTFVPFNTAQVVISPQTVPLNYDAGSIQSRVVYYQSSFQVLRPIPVTPNTITGIAWFQPLGIPAPVAQAKPGNVFTPLNTTQITNTVTAFGWYQPLGRSAPVAQAKPGTTFVPFNTRQINSITGMGWYQPLSRSAPVAIAQAGFSFVPFNTRQIVTVQVAFDPFVKKRSKPKRREDDLLRQELEIKYKRRLAIEEAFWPPTTYELPPYKLPEHVKPAPDVSDLANVIMQVQQMRAAQARQQDEEDEKALLELLKREYGIEDV